MLVKRQSKARVVMIDGHAVAKDSIVRLRPLLLLHEA